MATIPDWASDSVLFHYEVMASLLSTFYGFSESGLGLFVMVGFCTSWPLRVAECGVALYPWVVVLVLVGISVISAYY
jgi:hypothetical protein